MPELHELAHVSRRGDASPDELTTNAWLVYEAVRGDAERRHATTDDRNGIPGLLWTGSVNAVMHGLWSNLTNNADDTASQTFKRQVNAYLSQTGNLVCTARSASRSTWWVRKTWNDSAGGAPDPAARVGKGTQPLHSDRVATPEPEVTSEFKCLWPECGKRFGSKAARSMHQFGEHKSAEEYILDVLREWKEPVSADALQQLLEGENYPGSEFNTRVTLAALEAKHLAVRGGTPRRQTWTIGSDTHHREPTPVKSSPAKRYACREPECGHSYDDASTRSAHELQAHPDMTSRRFPCRYNTCNARFYHLAPLAIHLARTHGVYQGTKANSALLEQAMREADSTAPPAPPARPETPPAPPAAPMPAEQSAAPSSPPAREAEPARPAGWVDYVDALEALLAEVREARAGKAEAEKLRKENEVLQRRLRSIAQAIEGE